MRRARICEKWSASFIRASIRHETAGGAGGCDVEREGNRFVTWKIRYAKHSIPILHLDPGKTIAFRLGTVNTGRLSRLQGECRNGRKESSQPDRQARGKPCAHAQDDAQHEPGEARRCSRPHVPASPEI